MREIFIPAKTIKVYSFNELCFNSKTRAVLQHSEDSIYPWEIENSKSLEEFCKALKIEVPYFQYGDCEAEIDDANIEHSYFSDPENKEELEALLVKLNQDSYCLTGYCMDADLINPFVGLMKYSNKDLQKSVQAAFDNWLQDYQSDWDHFFSSDYLDEQDDKEYHEDGTLFDAS